MFSGVKKKLTIQYTLSLLALLIIFIFIIFNIVSQALTQKQEHELQQFLAREKHEFFEDFFEQKFRKHDKYYDKRELEFDSRKKMFYYVYDSSHQLLFGEETIDGLSQLFERLEKNSQSNVSVMKETWNNNHLMVLKETLTFSETERGTIYVGMDITNETHFIENITWMLLGLTVLFSIFFGFLGYYFAGQAMKPIKTAFDAQRKFVSDASHELRTPLSIFYSSIDVLMREEKEKLSPFGQEVLHDIKMESEAMNKLINDLLFLARSDNNTLKMDKQEINLSEQISSLFGRLQRTVPTGIDFISEIDSDIFLYGDCTKIQELIYILIDNAFRYTKQGFVKLSLKKQSDGIHLTVEDTGIGINQEDLPHIFDRFYRGDEARVRDGSGLGLAIAKSIVTAHNGEISAKSEPGVGTIITVVFKETERPSGKTRK